MSRFSYPRCTGMSHRAMQLLLLTLVFLFAFGTAAQTAPFTVSVTPASLTAYPGTSHDIKVQVSSSSGYQGTVNVTLSGLPGGVTANPATLSLAPGASGTITLNSSLYADAAAFTGITNGSANTSTRPVTFVGNSGGSSASTILTFTTSLSNSGFNPDPGSSGLPVVQVTTTGGAPITAVSARQPLALYITCTSSVRQKRPS